MILVVPRPGSLGDTPGDVEAAARAVGAHVAGAYEAKQMLLRGVPFTVAGEAAATAALVAAGVDALAVADDALERVPEPQPVARFRLFAEGIEVTTEAGAVLAVRWSDAQLVMPARTKRSTHTQLTDERKRGAGFNVAASLKPAKVKVSHAHDESDARFTLLLARAPDALLRFDEHGVDYEGLGAERKSTASANYTALLRYFDGLPRDDRLERVGARLVGAPSMKTNATKTTVTVKQSARTVTTDGDAAVVLAARLLCLAARSR